MEHSHPIEDSDREKQRGDGRVSSEGGERERESGWGEGSAIVRLKEGWKQKDNNSAETNRREGERSMSANARG